MIKKREKCKLLSLIMKRIEKIKHEGSYIIRKVLSYPITILTPPPLLLPPLLPPLQECFLLHFDLIKKVVVLELRG